MRHSFAISSGKFLFCRLSLTCSMIMRPKFVKVTQNYKDATVAGRMVQDKSSCTTSVSDLEWRNTCADGRLAGRDLRLALIGCGGGVRVAILTNHSVGFSIWGVWEAGVTKPCGSSYRANTPAWTFVMWQLENFSWAKYPQAQPGLSEQTKGNRNV